MEEDIKILEKFCKNPIGVNYSETKQAIENILNRLEQLEKENKELKGKYNIQPVLVNNSMFFIDNELYENLLVDINKNYIPKSVIRDKIEELEKELKEYEESDMEQDEDYYFDMNAYDGKLDILKEILGEE